MAQADHQHAGGDGRDAPPRWSQALRALREARGITQEGWAAQLGYGRATVRRWEAGTTVPSAEAEAAIIALCGEKRLYRTFTDGPLAGVRVSPEWIADLLAAARLGSEAPAVADPPPPRHVPVRYARSGDVSIAYQVFGDGPLTLVVTPGAVSHREVDWEHPGARTYFEALARFARVIVFDKRGTGMSDRVATGTLEERMDDIRAVMDAAGAERAALFGVSEGGPISMLFAATHPERISALVLYGTYDRVEAPAPVDPVAQLERLQQVWGTVDSPFLERFGPSAAHDPAEREWWARLQRMSASPGAVLALNRMNAQIDVREVLPTLRLPVMVLHRTGDRVVDVRDGRALADRIPGARFVTLPGEDHLPWLGGVTEITDAVERFLTEARPAPPADRLLATVLRAELDNAAGATWVRYELARCHGTLMPTNRGVLATFDAPTGALHAAASVQAASRAHGGARIGIHVGEVTRESESIRGETVRIAETLAAAAAPGEVLVSEVVVGLTAGAGVAFTPREVPSGPGDGPHALRAYAIET